MTFSEQVGKLRRTLHRAFSQRLAQRSPRPMLQLRALWVVSRGESRTQAELAERLQIDAPAASRLVARLQDEGLMRQKAGPDRRSVRLEVTRRARPAVKVMTEAIAWLDREVGKHLTHAERAKVMAVLRKVDLGLGARP